MKHQQRYNRQIILKEFGMEAQRKLSRASVLIVGAGGLGIPAMQYLNAMGVGTLGIVDNDLVSLSNLHRQVIYTEEEIGKPKLGAAARFLKRQNSHTEIDLFYTLLDKDNAFRIIQRFDLVIDATDNFAARYLINDACVLLGKPFIYGALHGFEGHLSVFNYNNGPTYRCLFPEEPSKGEIPDCTKHGVLGVIPGIIGNMQALEAVKILCGIGEILSGKLMIYNGLIQQFYFMDFQRSDIEITALKETYETPCEIGGVDAGVFIKSYGCDELQVIDVRTQQEFNDFNLRQSINIPLDELQEKSALIDSRRKVYFLCQSGVRSQKAVRLILEKFPNIAAVHVMGGINALGIS